MEPTEATLIATLRDWLESTAPAETLQPAAEDEARSERSLAALRESVIAYTREARDAGTLPEHVLIRLKTLVRSVHLPSPDDGPLTQVVVGWSVSTYFENAARSH